MNIFRVVYETVTYTLSTIYFSQILFCFCDYFLNPKFEFKVCKKSLSGRRLLKKYKRHLAVLPL